MSHVNRRGLAIVAIVVLAAAIVAASVLIWSHRTFAASDTPVDETADILAHELEVRIGQFEDTASGPRLVVSLTNKRDVVAGYTVGIGAFQGDGNTQIAAATALATIAAGATQDVEVFTDKTAAVTKRLRQAQFRVIGAWSANLESRT